jgi:uncharacterized SAM-binding protein YcdF (DUF218 family)
LQRQKPARKPRHGYISAKRRQGERRIGWRGRSLLAGGVLVVGLFGWAFVARKVAPSSNTPLGRFDAIIVLGSPADSDGNPTPQMLARVSEAVREYGRGIAPRLILTGGAAHSHFVEAQVMARAAEAEGIPESAIFVEPHATNTIENVCYSARIMKQHGWQSAEVVSTSWHLPRAAMILERLPIKWRIHAAPGIEPESDSDSGAGAFLETLKTVRYLTYASWADRCEP